MGVPSTTATEPCGADLLLEPPQPATTRASATTRRGAKRAIFMEKAASSSLPHVEDSIDDSKCLAELLSAQGNLLARRGVDGGVDARAKLPQLTGSEHERPDRRPTAAEDEVV